MLGRGPASLIALALLAAPLTGCVALDDLTEEFTDNEEPLEVNEAQRQQGSSEQMTVDEETREEEGVDENVLPFYARRIIELNGQMVLDRLPTLLSTVNGNVDITTEIGNTWALTAVLEGRGMTPQQAADQRERLSFEWSIGQPGDHHLVGQVQHEDRTEEGILGTSALAKGTIDLTIPSDVRLDLDASTTNGNIDLKGLLAEDLILSSTNGNVDVEAHGLENAELSTTNGNIDAELTPGEDGNIGIGSTNGNVDLQVPEDRRHGYDLEASTTNGNIDIELEDGDTSYDQDGDHATFQTYAFDGRSVQTDVALSTTNGNIDVSPA